MFFTHIYLKIAPLDRGYKAVYFTFMDHDISHAMRYFKDLVSNRKLADYLMNELHLSRSQYLFMRKIAAQEKRPTYALIYLLRNAIAPVQWYYSEDKAYPDPVHFTPLYNNYATETRSLFAQKKTCGHLFFDMLKEYKVFEPVCSLHNMKKSTAVNYVYMKKDSDNVLRYPCRPSIWFVSHFIDIIHPDYWYIFPDELSKESLADFMHKACEYANDVRLPRVRSRKK